MIIMSIDYGDARTGIAVCDKTEFLASPLSTLKSYNTEKLIENIINLAGQKKIGLFVVGLPKNMDGTLGERARKCIDFAESLSKMSGIPYVLQDERLTTVSAHIALNNADIRGTERKNTVDQVSAVIILQDYLDHKKIVNDMKG